MNALEYRFELGLLELPEVRELIHQHLTQAVAQTPQESAHGLDTSGLSVDSVRFWSCWDSQRLLAIGAWKALSQKQGEIKSMHTAKSARGKGVGSAVLIHLIEDAEAAGIEHLYLQTGSGAFFAPAVSLYARHGFRECAPFAEYQIDPNSIYMDLSLDSLKA